VRYSLFDYNGKTVKKERKKMAAKKESGITVSIPSINLKKMVVKIQGTSPLIVHQWSEKAKKEMLDAQTGNKTKAKEFKNPLRDFIDATYWIEGKPTEYTEKAFNNATKNGAKFGFPSIGFKRATATAGFRNKITKDIVSLLGAFYLEGELTEIVGAPIMREDMVKLSNGSADLRYRPEFTEWSAELNITYNADYFTPSQLVNLINLGGFSVGVGEWRPEKKGQYGMFKVV
jgi:hypothetical protein